MNMIFVRESGAMKTSILRLAGEVERRLAAVLTATERRDTDALKSWMARDSEIDDWEVRIEEECLKILALHQPVARDLRFVVAVLKINNDLERIGDHATNIAEDVAYLVDGTIIRHQNRHRSGKTGAETAPDQREDQDGQ